MPGSRLGDRSVSTAFAQSNYHDWHDEPLRQNSRHQQQRRRTDFNDGGWPAQVIEDLSRHCRAYETAHKIDCQV